MGIIHEIFQTYGPEYLRLHGRHLSSDQMKVVSAIMGCKTELYGHSAYRCDQCHSVHTVYHSCGNRHCPNCQHHKTMRWFEKRMQDHLPGPHFMLTFTVPEPLRRFMRRHQAEAYNALFAASAEAIKVLAKDEKHIGGDLTGFFGVLHTWTRRLFYHPHIHYVTPAGAMDKKTDRWKPAKNNFYLPVKALSKIYRAKFRDLLCQKGLINEVPPWVWKVDFNVHCKPIQTVGPVLKYLAPYVYRVAISDSRIIKVEKGFVWFHYKKKNSNRLRVEKVPVLVFIDRFLNHVLPTGFMKVRYYGFLSGSSSVSIPKARALIELSHGFEFESGDVEAELEPSRPPVCSKCGGILLFIYKEYPPRRLRSG